jgi:hypothetical protein
MAPSEMLRRVACKNRRFGGCCSLFTDSCHPDDGGAKFLRDVLTRATRRNIPEDAILRSHRRENLKYYMLIRSRVLSRTGHLGF